MNMVMVLMRRALDERASERGAGVVEWLGISALSIALLVAVFAALEAVGLNLVSFISSSLGI